MHHRSNRGDNEKAQRLLDRALELDDGYAHAHAWKACVLGQTWVHNWCESRPATEARISAELQLALALDDNDSDVHRILASINVVQNHLDQAVYHQRRALALNPNDDLIVVQEGEILTWLGRADEGIEWIRKAMRLNPYHPERFWSHLAACFAARRYQEAIDALCITRPDAAQLAQGRRLPRPPWRRGGVSGAARRDTGPGAGLCRDRKSSPPCTTCGRPTASIIGRHCSRPAFASEFPEAATIEESTPRVLRGVIPFRLRRTFQWHSTSTR